MDTANSVSASVSVQGLVAIIISLICIALAWWALQNLKLDVIIRHPQSSQGKMLHLLLAIIIGSLVARFVMDYWGWTQGLKYLF
ncbi:putative integral membrane protein (TIGR02327 family) [Paenibacillus sediminis]|uniref:Integral membrane protein (TIGR02327 family) n=2 Tax=Paenibacillus sediminis TaxID=664909 RepID=A0ABS4H2E8_9BACL|nr:putative integral membrane protein (TIGR02327 family) [Paenibacillus sediminis]